MIDLKWEFDEIIREFGHPVILIRTYKGRDCNCVTELSQSANPKCPVCFGTGKINSSEIIKIRNVNFLEMSKAMEKRSGIVLEK